jgi:hypothetical protein
MRYWQVGRVSVPDAGARRAAGTRVTASPLLGPPQKLDFGDRRKPMSNSKSGFNAAENA